MKKTEKSTLKSGEKKKEGKKEEVKKTNNLKDQATLIEAIEKAGGIENLIPPEDVRPGRCGGCDVIITPR